MTVDVALHCTLTFILHKTFLLKNTSNSCRTYKTKSKLAFLIQNICLSKKFFLKNGHLLGLSEGSAYSNVETDMMFDI
jgi:hypothetical protein